MMVYMGAVAAGGQAAVPRLVDQVDAPAVLFPSETRTSRTGTLIQGDTARILGDMMAYNVTQTYGADRFGGLDVCAKSGTAEVGGGQSPHAWFTGFVRDADHPYAALCGTPTTPTPLLCWWRTAAAAPGWPGRWRQPSWPRSHPHNRKEASP